MYRRYAIYYTPAPGPLAEFGASWLGWDPRRGQTVSHLEVTGLDVAQLTATPRKYGFHATLKAPFRLAEGKSEKELLETTKRLAQDLQPLELADVQLVFHHGFVALRPAGGSAPETPLGRLADAVVTGLDRYRAPLTSQELERRRKSALNSRQESNLEAWGYPYVKEDFHWHMTLTGRVNSSVAARVIDHLQPEIDTCLAGFLPVDALSVMGEGEDGKFRELSRFLLSNTTS